MFRFERFAHQHLLKRKYASVIFFDIIAGFDNVWFDGLIYKLYYIFEKCCSLWKLTIQPVKSELLYFCPHLQKKCKNKIEIEVGDVNITSTLSARYLGVIFDHKLDWRIYVKHIETKAASRINLLRFLSKLNPNANLNAMLTLYKSLARSIIT
jgi:hypothetical protein